MRGSSDREATGDSSLQLWGQAPIAEGQLQDDLILPGEGKQGEMFTSGRGMGGLRRNLHHFGRLRAVALHTGNQDGQSCWH